MPWAEIRGLIAFAAVIGAIVFAWSRIENHDTDASAVPAVTSQTTTTTTTIPTSTTTTPEQAQTAVCERTKALVLELFVEGAPDEGSKARLMEPYWTDLLELVTPAVRVELFAVVDYYGDYLAEGGPLDFDTARIIVEGDKERWEQLITRPARGLEEARSMVSTLCGVDVPDQHRMDDDDFQDLEDRLLDDDD